MNSYIHSQIFNMITVTKTFEQGCKMAVLKDDGRIDKAEEKALKQIEKATQRFIKDLNCVK